MLVVTRAFPTVTNQCISCEKLAKTTRELKHGSDSVQRFTKVLFIL